MNEADSGSSDKHYTPDQQALIDLAKNAKRRGKPLSEEEAKSLNELADEVGLANRPRESHPDRLYGKQPHIHVGPVNHIPVE